MGVVNPKAHAMFQRQGFYLVQWGGDPEKHTSLVNAEVQLRRLWERGRRVLFLNTYPWYPNEKAKAEAEEPI